MQRTTVVLLHQIQRTDLQKQRDSLIDYLHRELIDEEEYKYQRGRLQTEIEKVDGILRNTERRADDWMELNEKAFNFAAHAYSHFKNLFQISSPGPKSPSFGCNPS